MTGTVSHRNGKKLLGQMLVGAVVGGAATGGLLMVWKGRGLDLSDPAQMFALVAGMIYLLIGMMVGFGALAPRAGARFLNVEDVDELRVERPILGFSAIACVLTGMFFLVLAAIPADGSDGLVNRDAAAVVAAACLTGLVAMTRSTNRRVDELTRQVSMEASALAMHAVMLFLCGWAALAHLGYANWISPLAFVSALALLLLASVFWVGAKRGMVTPR